jgi:hypothetical protein
MVVLEAQTTSRRKRKARVVKAVVRNKWWRCSEDRVAEGEIENENIIIRAITTEGPEVIGRTMEGVDPGLGDGELDGGDEIEFRPTPTRKPRVFGALNHVSIFVFLCR